jgi:hypothetical protein
MQPLIGPTIRYTDEHWSIELVAGNRTVTITPTDLRVMTAQRLEIIEWGDLLEIIDDLAYQPDETDAPGLDALVWLLSRPGVVRAPQPASQRGFLWSDDYDPATTYAV